MRYIQSLVTRTRQTDKIPMTLMLDAINHTLASSYGIEFESVLPTYLCDCKYDNFKTSSFHKRFNPCHNCLLIDLEKTVSRTFRYANKDDVKVKDPVTEKETVFLFFGDEDPKVEINSKEKIQRGFIGEDPEGRALPKELIAEFKKDEDWDDFYSEDDSSWENYDSDYAEYSDYSGEGADYQDENIDSESGSESDNESLNEEDYEGSVEGLVLDDDNSVTLKDISVTESKLASVDFDFQILQQIKSKKYILDVDQKIIITNVTTVDLDKVPTKEESGDDLNWIHSLQDFLRCGWCRINILRNSGDGDKELGMISAQLRLMSEAYKLILDLLNDESIATSQNQNSEEDSESTEYPELKDSTTALEKELMPVLKKMVTLGKDKDAMLIAKNWLPILEELFPYDDAEDSSVSKDEKDHLLLAGVMAVLGVLEFRRRQDGWAGQHLLQSIKLAYEYALSKGESFDLFAYLGDPKVQPSSTSWLLTQTETFRLSELLADRAQEYLSLKQQWSLYESILTYIKKGQSDMDDKEHKKSGVLINNLTKKMLKESETMLKEDEKHFVPKIAQLQYNMAHYYASKEKWEESEWNLSEAMDLLYDYPELLPLNLKVDILALSIVVDKPYADKIDDTIKELIEASSELYSQAKDLESLKKVVEAYIEQINLDVDKLESLSPRKRRDEDDENIEDAEVETRDEDSLEQVSWGSLFDKEEDNFEGEDNYLKNYLEHKEEAEEREDEEDEDWDEDYIFEDDEIDVESKITELKQEVVKDFIKIQGLIDDYKKISSDEVKTDTQPPNGTIEQLEIRVDITKLRYLTKEPNQDNDQKAFELYQDLIRRTSQMLESNHDQWLYETYKDIVRANGILCFELEKYNEVKKGYKQLISYQKNMIDSMPQKGRTFQEANLDLAQTYCYLGAYYWDLKTYDHALKYALLAQSLVDKYADMKVRSDVEIKFSVYSFLYLLAKDADRKDIEEMAHKEGSKLERMLHKKS